MRTKQVEFLRGYGFQGGGQHEGWERGIAQTEFGPEFKKSMSQPGPVAVQLSGVRECLPNHNNYAELDKEKVDAWGIRVLKIHCASGENERTIRKDMSIAAAEMLAAAGARDIEPFTDDDPPGFSIHEMGTARMGRDPKTSVLNCYNRRMTLRTCLSATEEPWFRRQA